jgi:hypothetical protein
VLVLIEMSLPLGVVNGSLSVTLPFLSHFDSKFSMDLFVPDLPPGEERLLLRIMGLSCCIILLIY